VLAVSAVQFASGYRADLRLLARACREREIILSVDVMQAAGWLRLDLGALGAGLVAAGASKWMSGPQGVGFAHVREDLLPHLRPAHFGIGAVARKESYFDYDPEPDATALRFEESVVSILDTTAFRASLSLLHEAGADALEDRVRALSHRLASGLSDLGCAIVGPWPRAPEHSSGIVSFRVPRIEAEAVLQALASQRIVGRTHRDFVRLSPHAWNTEAEIDRALEVVGSVRRQAMPRAIAPGSG
jgi:selenocysteine lyase/cysteine desulfurase